MNVFVVFIRLLIEVQNPFSWALRGAERPALLIPPFIPLLVDNIPFLNPCYVLRTDKVVYDLFFF